MCALGGAACLALAKPSMRAEIRRYADVFYIALGLWLAKRIENANDCAADVPDMVRRVKVVLRGDGL